MSGSNAFGWAYPGQGYLTGAPEYTDSATVTVALLPTSAELVEFVDSATALVDVQASGTDEYTSGGITYTDSDTAVLQLSPSVAEVFEGVDSSIVLETLVSSGTDQLVLPSIEDSATVLVDLITLGGECLSTFTGLQLDAEAYCRWNPSADEDRWAETEDCRWIASDAIQLHPIDGEGFQRWYPTDDEARWLADDEVRWQIVGLTVARIAC